MTSRITAACGRRLLAAFALCAALATLAAATATAEAGAMNQGFQVAKFKVEIDGYQNTTWHRTVEPEDECGTGDHSFGREKVTFHSKSVYINATHNRGEFNPSMFGLKQLGFPVTVKVQRSFTPVITQAKICEDNGGGAEITKPDCGTRTVKKWNLNLQYASDEKNVLLLSPQGGDDPFVNCPGIGAGFPSLLIEGSGHEGSYIGARVTQEELFDPEYQQWIAIADGSAKDGDDSWWSKADIHWSVSFTRVKG